MSVQEWVLRAVVYAALVGIGMLIQFWLGAVHRDHHHQDH